jgi:hypothetical protein
MAGPQKLHDSYYNEQLNKIKDAVHNELNTAGIGFCQACWTAYEKWLCAAATPQCGMAECYQNNIGNATDCINACPCDPMNEFVVQPDCYRCVMGCTNAAVGKQCGQYGLSKNSCKQLVNICGCNPKQQDARLFAVTSLTTDSTLIWVTIVALVFLLGVACQVAIKHQTGLMSQTSMHLALVQTATIRRFHQ